MPTPLPSAFRVRFEEYIAEGLSGRAAAARLKLSAATGVRWKRKLCETDAIEPAPRGRRKGHGKLAPHQAFLEELVAQDEDITLELYLNLGDAHYQAGWFSVSAVTLTQSLPLIALMTFGNWFLPLSRNHFFDAA